MKLWYSELGYWSLIATPHFSLTGTTPRNAGIWTLSIDVGKYALEFRSGEHASVEWWVGKKMRTLVRRVKKNCACYNCRTIMPPSLEVWEAMVKAMDETEQATRKLPDRTAQTGRLFDGFDAQLRDSCGRCQPADCCGGHDPEEEQ